MGGFSVGEDLFTTLMVFCVAGLFVAALGHSYHLYAKREAAHRDFELTMEVANRLKNDVLAKHGEEFFPSLINPEGFDGELSEYLRLLANQGIKIRVEIRSLSGKLVLAKGLERDPIGEYFSPPCSVSLPVTFGKKSSGSRELCELVVRVWSA